MFQVETCLAGGVVVICQHILLVNILYNSAREESMHVLKQPTTWLETMKTVLSRDRDRIVKSALAIWNPQQANFILVTDIPVDHGDLKLFRSLHSHKSFQNC